MPKVRPVGRWGGDEAALSAPVSGDEAVDARPSRPPPRLWDAPAAGATPSLSGVEHDGEGGAAVGDDAHKVAAARAYGFGTRFVQATQPHRPRDATASGPDSAHARARGNRSGSTSSTSSAWHRRSSGMDSSQTAHSRSSHAAGGGAASTTPQASALWDTEKVDMLGSLLAIGDARIGTSGIDVAALLSETRGVVDPTSQRAHLWRWLVTAAVVLAAALAPFAAVMPVVGLIGLGLEAAVDIPLYVSDAVLAVDVALQLRMGVVRDGNKVMRRSEIRALRLASPAFWLSAVAALPVSLLPGLAALVKPASIATPALAGALRAACLLKLLRLPDVWRHLGEAELLPHTNATAVRVGKLLLAVLLLAHIAGCGWLAFAYSSGFAPPPTPEQLSLGVVARTSWLPPATLVGQPAPDVYAAILYFGVGALSGTLDVAPPETRLQAVFTKLLMVSGLLMSAFVIGSVHHLVEVADRNRARFAATLNDVNHFMRYHGLPRDVQDSVLAYHKSLWEETRGFDEGEVLRGLPHGLRQDVARHLTHGTLAAVPVFAGCEDAFMASLVPRLKPELVLAGTKVLRQGAAAGRIDELSLYIVRSGRLRVRVRATVAEGAARSGAGDDGGGDASDGASQSSDGAAGGVTAQTLGPGSYFGERAILAAWRARMEADAREMSGPFRDAMIRLASARTSSVEAQTICHLFKLSERDLHDVLEVFPASRAAFIRNATERLAVYAMADEAAQAASAASPSAIMPSLEVAPAAGHRRARAVSEGSAVDSVRSVGALDVARLTVLAPLSRLARCCCRGSAGDDDDDDDDVAAATSGFLPCP
uniref:Cyclic nucleotide-binding domain-containing protein n=1 Tax=Bicosoecida sp. CB-2014 TaxID=1486930 RepID=A0A7S1CL47_9STRA|mmetsp:Transcript_2827/g.9998  ORF Transcript_2827/g.9998 Transcript_2827/m.9998 type:complete len:821 (+) Transcript_2827:91-2553(+)